jgi:FkbM family methyltransferase
MLIDFNKLWPKYNIHPKGVLHVGSSKGQETEHYVNLGVNDVVYIEALPNVFKDLVEHVKKFKGKFTCINACISEIDGGEVIFNVANNEGQSSSMLEFGTHSKQHPSVKFNDHLKLTTIRIDGLYQKYGLNNKYDFLNVDLQGSEMAALKSMGHHLNEFKWAYVEVNKEPLYIGCPLIGEIDEYLGSFGFIRVETKWSRHMWGDAMYERKGVIN